jgi:predicted RecA/RadA family phage recombinase
MAKNMVHDPGEQLQVTLADVESGDPVAVGELPGVALTDTQADGTCTIKCNGVFLLPVNGAIEVGDILYLATGVLSTTDTGVRFGYALEANASGNATKKVKVGY